VPRIRSALAVFQPCHSSGQNAPGWQEKEMIIKTSFGAGTRRRRPQSEISHQ